MIIGLEIPEKYSRTLTKLRVCSDNKRTPKGRPITNDWVYENYRSMMERLNGWLLDHMIERGYGTEAKMQPFRFIGLSDNKVSLELLDCPFDCFWTCRATELLSDQYRFGGLWDLWGNDP